MSKRILSMILAVVMVVMMLPVANVFAAETTTITFNVSQPNENGFSKVTVFTDRALNAFEIKATLENAVAVNGPNGGAPTLKFATTTKYDEIDGNILGAGVNNVSGANNENLAFAYGGTHVTDPYDFITTDLQMVEFYIEAADVSQVNVVPTAGEKNAGVYLIGDQSAESALVFKTVVEAPVVPDPTIEVLLDKATVVEGESAKATADTKNADGATVVWTTSAPAVATVDADGNITTLKAGTATITGTITVNGKEASDSATLTVDAKPVPTITATVPTTDLEIGETVDAEVKTTNADGAVVVWTTSNDKVATVVDGTVTAVAEGTATITATITVDGTKYEATFDINVAAEPVIPAEIVVNITQDDITMIEGKELQLLVTVDNATDTTVTWTSSDEAVATVAADGTVTALKAGTVTITATSVEDDTKSDTAAITVKAPSTGTPTSPTSPSTDNIIRVPDVDWNAGSIVLDLTGDKDLVHFTVIQRIQNSFTGKEVVVKGYYPTNTGYTITFAAGTVKDLPSVELYDFRLNSTSQYDTQMKALAGSAYVATLGFNSQGSLPAVGTFNVYVGTEYAGKTLYYNIYNPATGKLEQAAVVVVAENGTVTFKSNVAKDGVFSTSSVTNVQFGGNTANPETGADNTIVFVAVASAVLLLAAAFVVGKKIKA